MNELVPISTFKTVTCISPFSIRKVDSVALIGKNVVEIMHDSNIIPRKSVDIHVMINDKVIPKDQWEFIEPSHGDVVYIRPIPQFGGGGGGALRVVLMIAVIVAASVLAPGVGLGAALASQSIWAVANVAILTKVAFVGMTALGMLAINAIAPPKTPNIGSLSANSGIGTSSGVIASPNRSSTSVSPSLSGGNNQFDPYGPIPVILGQHKVIPPYASKSYTEIVGNDQFLRILFCFYGRVDISSMKFGDTDIAAYDGIETETREGTSGDTDIVLFPDAIDEQGLQIFLENSEGWFTRTTVEDTDEISVDVTFLNGLFEYNNLGAREQRTVNVEWEYSIKDAGIWSGVKTISTTSSHNQTVRSGDRVIVAARNQFDVRMRRSSADTDDNQIIDKVYWTALRSITDEDPIQTGDLTLGKIAIRVKASDEFSGIIDTFNFVGYSKVLDWNGAAWVEGTSSNPASLFRHVLQGVANKRAVANARIDLAKLQDWHDFCVTNGFTFNKVIDYQSSVEEVLDLICAAGRGSRTYFDGKHSVIFDEEQSTPRQQFSPRNSWDFSSQKTFYKQPHAFRVRFPNADAEWQEDERIVYDDGYSEETATVFEQLELPGVTSSDLAWKHGRYHIATARLRPELYSFYVDPEHLICTRGDMIKMSHDVALWGVSWGRVTVIQTDNGNTTGISLDQEMPMEAGSTYAICFRKVTGVSVLANIVLDIGNQTIVIFETPIVTANGPAVGDIGQFGKRNTETVELLIKSIEPQQNLNAMITAVDVSPAVYIADTGSIPAFDSQITLPYDVPKTIGSPSIQEIRSDENVLILSTDGHLVPRIVITFEWKSGQLFDQIMQTEVLWRLAESDGPWERINYPNYIPEASIQGVDDGYSYDLKCRYHTIGGKVSPWVEVDNYIVIGKTSPPPDVPTLVLENTIIRWTYGILPLDFAGFRVRHRAGTDRQWADAIDAHNDLIKGTIFNIAALPTGVQTIMVKAEDVAGNQSENPAILVKDFGDFTVDNVITTYDYAINGFPGTITDGTIDGTDLEADGSTVFWAIDGNTTFWDPIDATVFWNPVYLEMSYEFDYTPFSADLPAKISLTCDIQGSPWSIYYALNGDDLFWADPDDVVFWSAIGTDLFWDAVTSWLTWPGFLNASRQKYLFKIVTGSGTTRGIIFDLVMQIDVSDINEYLEDVAIGALGTRLSLTKTYRSIVTVQVTLQDDGGDGVIVRIVDKSLEGPLIDVLDIIEIGTTGLIDAHVQGY